MLEGESLINDATGLVAYRIAVAAAVTGSFSAFQTGGQFLYVSIVGTAIGLVAALLISRVRRKLHDPPVEITISLLTPYAAYLPAEAVGASGVLAAVACGLYLGRQAPRIMDAETRVQGRAVWETLVFLLNGLVFMLIGLQLPSIIAGLRDRPPEMLIGLAGWVCHRRDRRALHLGLRERPAAVAPRIGTRGARTWCCRGRRCAAWSRSPRRWRCR